MSTSQPPGPRMHRGLNHTEWVARGMVTNQNMAIGGEPGLGKSATVLAMMLRLSLCDGPTTDAGGPQNPPGSAPVRAGAAGAAATVPQSGGDLR